MLTSAKLSLRHLFNLNQYERYFTSSYLHQFEFSNLPTALVNSIDAIEYDRKHLKITIKPLVSYEQIVRSFIWNQRMIYKEFNNAAE